MPPTCTQDMLLTASLAGRELAAQSLTNIGDFFARQQLPCGGFAGRDGQSDLYYTLFGIAGLLAAGRIPDISKLGSYLGDFENNQNLDFVHRVTLLRCRTSLRYARFAPEYLLKKGSNSGFLTQLIRKAAAIMPVGQAAKSDLREIEEYRSADGGYHHATPDAQRGSAYAAFLAYLAYQDAMASMPYPDKLRDALQTMRQNDGSYANVDDLHSGSTTTTAAAVVLLSELGMPVDEATINSLLERLQPDGGFSASRMAPAADLLSTATAVYALKRADISLAASRDSLLDFVSSLWNNDGGFSGCSFDEKSDSEYTFYGLLALGSLA